jgi:oligopeptide/dipeptide ABC transporter ATP-binding protein
MSAPEQLVSVANLTKHFEARRGLFGAAARARPIRAVDGVSFEIAPGKTLGLVGESGSGKSTLGRTVLRLLEPTSGTITIAGTDVTALDGKRLRAFRRHAQMIFQDPYASLNPRMTAARIIGEPLRVHDLVKDRAEESERVRALLDAVGLRPEVADRYPHEFSGGQRQRIGIARALAVSPELIVADEPISALDVSIQAQIVNLLVDLQAQRGLTYLFISHDLKIVQRICDEVAVMYLGRIVERAPAASLYTRPLHPYTRALLSAIPQIGERVGARRARAHSSLTGELPSPANPPPGCAFHPRCPLYAERGRPAECRETTPALADKTPGHAAACHLVDL